MSIDKLEVDVTFDPKRGYIASALELREPVVALSLGGLRRPDRDRDAARRAHHRLAA